MMISFKLQSELVRSILLQWRAYEWTVQGFGFIRTKIGTAGRIHVWDSKLSVSRVSTVHTHPWPLVSTVISGELINQRFEIDSEGPVDCLHSRLKTGEGGHLVGETQSVRLKPSATEFYTRGQSYSQKPEEIHCSIPAYGTVTLMERPQGPPLEEASVYWPAGTEWVTAEPRRAKDYEIEDVISFALQRWNQ
jgi:hypothetical protein